MRSRGKMLGQRPTRRLASLEATDLDLLVGRRGRHLLRPRRRLGCILLEIGQLQLELLEHGAALGGLTEPRMPQLGNHELQLVDQQRAILRLALRGGGLCLCGKQRLALREDNRLGSYQIGRERISGVVHKQTSAQMRADVNR
jgi:hypothetical protein